MDINTNKYKFTSNINNKIKQRCCINYLKVLSKLYYYFLVAVADDSIYKQDHPVLSVKKHVSKEAKIFNNLRYVVSAYLILWSPYYVFNDVAIFYTTDLPYMITGYVLVSGLFYINSAVNPFMYAFGNDKIRKAIGKVRKFIFRR